MNRKGFFEDLKKAMVNNGVDEIMVQPDRKIVLFDEHNHSYEIEFKLDIASIDEHLELLDFAEEIYKHCEKKIIQSKTDEMLVHYNVIYYPDTEKKISTCKIKKSDIESIEKDENGYAVIHFKGDSFIDTVDKYEDVVKIWKGGDQ